MVLSISSMAVVNLPAAIWKFLENPSWNFFKLSSKLLIVKPEEGLSTKEVYSNYKGESIRIDTEGVIKGLETADENLIAKSIGNDLMPPAVYLLPKVGEIYSSLVKDGFKIVSMSGSGSSLFAMSFDLKKMKEAQKKYEKLGYISVLTKTLTRGANK